MIHFIDLRGNVWEEVKKIQDTTYTGTQSLPGLSIYEWPEYEHRLAR